MMVYKIDGLTKSYGAIKILDIPELNIEQGRIYALVGPNGAGKTTLLNILGFLETPSTGRIQYQDTLVKYQENHLQKHRKTVVMLDQHPILFSTTVYKNVEFGLKLRGIQKKKRHDRILETLDLVGMTGFSHYPAHVLSGGETQRVALAQALVVGPDVFLCDEPTSSIDVENQDVIMNILKRINLEKKITVLFTTHDRFQASELAHTTLVLDHGRLSGKGYENLYKCEFIPQGQGEWDCLIQNRIHLFVTGREGRFDTGSKRVFIDPAKIQLTEPHAVHDKPNFFRGKVIQVAEENGGIRVVVDIGLKLSLSLSKDSYVRVKPMVGELVGLELGDESIQSV